MYNTNLQLYYLIKMSYLMFYHIIWFMIVVQIETKIFGFSLKPESLVLTTKMGAQCWFIFRVSLWKQDYRKLNKFQTHFYPHKGIKLVTLSLNWAKSVFETVGAPLKSPSKHRKFAITKSHSTVGNSPNLVELKKNIFQKINCGMLDSLLTNKGY